MTVPTDAIHEMAELGDPCPGASCPGNGHDAPDVTAKEIEMKRRSRL